MAEQAMDSSEAAMLDSSLVAKRVDDFVRSSDSGDFLSPRFQRAPLHIFPALVVPARLLFPRLDHIPESWLPRRPISVRGFETPIPPTVPELPQITGSGPVDWTFQFPNFGSYFVTSDLGTFKCLIIDPTKTADSQLVEIFRFAAETIVHSCVDRSLLMPWSQRSRYLRPDKLLAKLFHSDQPVGLHCDGACDLTAYLLHLRNHPTRRVWMFNPETGDGHVVLEALLPDQQRWVMLDPDFGVLVCDSGGRFLSTKEIFEAGGAVHTLSIVHVASKSWLYDEFNVQSIYTGQMTWTPDKSRTTPAVENTEYMDIVTHRFPARRYYMYKYEDSFEDNLLDLRDLATA